MDQRFGGDQAYAGLITIREIDCAGEPPADRMSGVQLYGADRSFLSIIPHQHHQHLSGPFRGEVLEADAHVPNVRPGATDDELGFVFIHFQLVLRVPVFELKSLIS